MSHGGDDGLHEEHEEHVNHEAWVIPYADLLTLLMAMFIALFAMSTVDITKFKALAIGFNEALGGGHTDTGIGGRGKGESPLLGSGNDNGPFEGGRITPGESVDANTIARILAENNGLSLAKSAERESLGEVKRRIEERAEQRGFGGRLKIVQRNDGLLVTLVTDEIFFHSGQAELLPAGRDLLDIIGVALDAVDNALLISGYTDSDPIHTARFPSNDELSFSRALSVSRFLATLGIADERLRVAGRGARDFVAPNDTAAHKALNRRVEIIVQSNVVRQALRTFALDDAATPPTTTPISSPVTGGLGGAGGATPSLAPALGAAH